MNGIAKGVLQISTDADRKKWRTIPNVTRFTEPRAKPSRQKIEINPDIAIELLLFLNENKSGCFSHGDLNINVLSWSYAKTGGAEVKAIIDGKPQDIFVGIYL